MSRPRVGLWLLIVAYWAATTLGHLPVSLWLVRRRQSELLGEFQISEFLPAFAIVLLCLLLAWQIRAAFRAHDRRPTLVGWVLCIVSVVAIDRLLLYSFPEYLHYPQYALLAWLIAHALDADRDRGAFGAALLAATTLGILDEILQYVWLTISYSNYLDFNDFVLNLVGAAGGLLLFYGFRAGPETVRAGSPALREGTVGFLLLGTLLAVGLILLHLAAGDSPTLPLIERAPSYGHWIPGPHAGRYFVLSPALGIALLVALGIAFSAIGNRMISRSERRAA